MKRYLVFLRNQTGELLEKYGPLGIMWFDGDWEKPWKWEYGRELYRFLKRIQPDLIINNRLGRRKAPAGAVVGDYDTPEQHIGSFDRRRPWETCMTLCGQWAWKPNDRMKTLKECLHALIRTVGGDGNFLFNVGPMPDGRIEPRQAKRLLEMGEWLKKYGDYIYGTRGGPFKPCPFLASTCKGNKIYVFLMERPIFGSLELPLDPEQISGIHVLGGGKVDMETKGGNLVIDDVVLEGEGIAAVLEIETKGRAFDIEPVEVKWHGDSLALSKKAKASNVFRKMAGKFGPGKAFDGDFSTRWAADPGTRKAWIEVDLGTLEKAGSMLMDECVRFGTRVRKFQVLYKERENDPWKVLFEGKRIGRRLTKEFDPVILRFLRLVILDARDGPTIREIMVFPPKEKKKKD